MSRFGRNFCEVLLKIEKFVKLDGWRLLRVLFGGYPTLYAGSCLFLLTDVCVTVWGDCPFSVVS